MDQSAQDNFRPVIDSRLAAIEVELARQADSTKPIAPDVSVGRLSRLDSMQMQQMALAGRRRLEDQWARLQEAHRRIASRTFGSCLRCGADIALERLKLQPDAVMCMPCLSTLAPKRAR